MTAEVLDQWSNYFWPLDNDMLESWTIANRFAITTSNPTAKQYFDTLEHNLNTAIYFCACALNYYASQSPICDCSGEVAEDGLMEYYKQQQADWLSQEQGWEQAWTTKFEIANIMAVFGVIMSLLALAVVKQIDIIVPFI